MADPRIRIVSLTVTEGGYNLDAVTGEFVLDEPGVAADLADGAVPRTSFGLVTEALRRRRERGVAPFTVMSCDNIQGNGHAAHKVFVAFATAKDPELGAWVDANVKLPEQHGRPHHPRHHRRRPRRGARAVRDRGRLAGGLRAVRAVGAGGRLRPRPPPLRGRRGAGRRGRRAVRADEAAAAQRQPPGAVLLRPPGRVPPRARGRAGPAVRAVPARPTWNGRARPTLPPVPGDRPRRLPRTSCISRFSNGEVRDTVARLCTESSDRIPKWLLPVVRDNIAAGGECVRSAAVVASWARYAEGVDEQGEPIEVSTASPSGSSRPRSATGASRLRSSPTARCSATSSTSPGSPSPTCGHSTHLHRVGARATLEQLTAPSRQEG